MNSNRTTGAYIKLFLSAIFFINTSCIHTKSKEIVPVVIDNNNNSYQLLSNDLMVKSFVYSESKYPLSEFFDKLSKGEFKDSFKNVSLTYKPSNTTNEVLRNLLKNGLVPVYVTLKNISSQDMKISFNQFQLSDGIYKFRAFDPSFVPNEIKRLSPTAIAANVYNITVSAVFSVLIFGMLTMASVAPNGSVNINGLTMNDNKVLNDTQKIIHFDYKNYILNEINLKPEEEFAGLLFFNTENLKDTRDFQLELKAN